jgi:LCP family protein required for cell wall assembly
MVVVTVEPKTGKVGMISLPRDLFVPIPGFDTSGKINTAFYVGEVQHYPGGGGALAKKTVGEFLGYPIDYYVKVNFDGFVQAVDAIGGIDIDVPKTIHDEQYPTLDYGYTTFHLDAGMQHMDGETALKYARTRHGDDDFQRARRQQQVLVAIKDQIIKDGLLSPKRALSLLGVLRDSVEHDVSTTELPKLIGLASRVQIDTIDQLVLDNRYGQISTTTRFGWILVPDRAKIRPAVDKIFTGTSIPSTAEVQALAAQEAQQQADLSRQQIQNDYQAQAEAVRKQLSEEGARVAVFNGTDDPMLAARAADWLQRQGYQVATYGQADRNDYPRTVLRTHADKPFTVASLQDMFAIAKNNISVSNNSADAAIDLQLIIGRDFYLLVSN